MATHSEKRILPFTARQLFELVADVERYPEFLPWCLEAHIHDRTENGFNADLVAGYQFFREGFNSTVRLTPYARIDIAYENGPFKYLENNWQFRDVPGGCELEFFIDFEFNGGFLNQMIEPIFNEAVQRMVAAFEKRARAIYP